VEKCILTNYLGWINVCSADSYRAAAVMSLIQSAKLNGHDPYAYLKDVLTRLPTHPNNRIEDLLPHRWTPDASA
jgi:hypothetical protein